MKLIKGGEKRMTISFMLSLCGIFVAAMVVSETESCTSLYKLLALINGHIMPIVSEISSRMTYGMMYAPNCKEAPEYEATG